MSENLHPLAVSVDDNGAAVIHDAIDRHHELSGTSGKHTHEANGQALVAICTEWRELAEARLKSARSGELK